MKKTPWFPADVKPVRRGLYETRGYLLSTTSFWTGVDWVTPIGKSRTPHTTARMARTDGASKVTLIPARALIGALTAEEARAIAADSWPWPMSEEASKWVLESLEHNALLKRLQQKQEPQFNRDAHDDFMRSL